jgi:hypothetical protein
MWWTYVGCKTDQIPKDILKDSSKMTSAEIKDLIDSVPLVEGKIQAHNVDAITALLMADNIFPLKIHPVGNRETKVDRLRNLINLVENNRPSDGDLKG